MFWWIALGIVVVLVVAAYLNDRRHHGGVSGGSVRDGRKRAEGRGSGFSPGE